MARNGIWGTTACRLRAEPDPLDLGAPASAKAEERQGGEDDDDGAHKPDDAVHDAVPAWWLKKPKKPSAIPGPARSQSAR
jgi:hypothetical protein